MRHKISTVASVLQDAIQALGSASPTPRLDAEVLVMHVCRLDRGELIAHRHAELTADQASRLDELLTRRQREEPIAYLTGRREFWSLELAVSPATLIPRPETELLVEKALAHIPQDSEWTIADLGTGSGAIALALAKERPHCRVIATDISRDALDVARLNAATVHLTRVEFRLGSWFDPFTGMSLDIIISNPPYVRVDDPHLQQGGVRFEPPQALRAGADGLEAIRHIVRHAQQHLKPGGRLLLEHGWDQAEAVGGLLRQQGYGDIVCYRDLSAHDRVTECRR